MKKFSKLIIILSVITLFFSLTTLQYGDEVKRDLKQKPVIMKSKIPRIMFDIRVKWKLFLTWTMEPPTWEWTFTFTGTKFAGTFKGIQKTHGHELLGTYKVNGMNVTFDQDPSTIDNSGSGTTFPLNFTGIFKAKNLLEGTFKCGPDTGTWTASRMFVMKKIPEKRLIPIKKPIPVVKEKEIK